MRFPAPERERTQRDLAAIREDGFVVIEGLLSAEELAEIRRELAPRLASDPSGRNNFEGYRTQRVYSLAGKGRIFEDLTEHPRILALCDALLMPNYLLTASQAICIHPGETPQPRQHRAEPVTQIHGRFRCLHLGLRPGRAFSSRDTEASPGWAERCWPCGSRPASAALTSPSSTAAPRPACRCCSSP